MSLLNYLLESKSEDRSRIDLKNLGDSLQGAKANYDLDPEVEYPITIKKSNWDVVDSPERFRRMFEFDDKNSAIYFFNELFKYQFEINHHCRIDINGLEITVETYTHDFNGITAQDKKIKKFADDLYADVNFFNKG